MTDDNSAGTTFQAEGVAAMIIVVLTLACCCGLPSALYMWTVDRVLAAEASP